MYSNILVSIDLGQPDNEAKAIEAAVEYAKVFGGLEGLEKDHRIETVASPSGVGHLTLTRELFEFLNRCGKCSAPGVAVAAPAGARAWDTQTDFVASAWWLMLVSVALMISLQLKHRPDGHHEKSRLVPRISSYSTSLSSTAGLGRGCFLTIDRHVHCAMVSFYTHSKLLQRTDGLDVWHM